MPPALDPASADAAERDLPAVTARTAGTPQIKSAVREYIEALAIAIVLAMFIRSFVVQAFKIPSGSMLPTLQVGDQILVNKFVYGLRLPVLNKHLVSFETPQRGDVVVFAYPIDPSKEFIKRVVGTAGDVIQIRHKHVYINGRVWDDPHAYFAEGQGIGRTRSPRDDFGPVTVPPGYIFVMGDNRDRSYDSRFWGFVDVRAVEGRAFLIYWSWNSTEHWVRWDRLGDLIH